MFSTALHRTPNICAMQQDNSEDLQDVGSILYDLAGVNFSASFAIFKFLQI